MNTTTLIMLPLILLMLLFMCITGHADDAELLLAEGNLHLDYKAEKTGWPSVVFAQLKKEFNVSDQRIYSLKQKGLSYSEINTVLSMAEQMPGGINDRNVDKVVRIHQGKDYTVGWDSIAKALGVDMTKTALHAKSVSESSWTNNPDTPEASLKVSRGGEAWKDLKVSDQVYRLGDGLRPGR